MSISEAYVLGLLPDIHKKQEQLRLKLEQGHARAGTVDQELTQLLGGLDEATDKLRRAQKLASKSSAEINERNLQIASLHNDIATQEKRALDIKVEMERVEPGAIQRRLRRERAKVRVRVREMRDEADLARQAADRERTALQNAEEEIVRQKDVHRALTQRLDALQSKLPDPYLYPQLAALEMAEANCQFVLEGQRQTWASSLRDAINLLFILHQDLRVGKYRLDRNSHLVGGRSDASAEALYAAVAIRQPKLATTLFDLMTDPSLLFDDILNVFRVWCLGLYLKKQHTDLRALLRKHQFAEGLRGAYVNAFIGLVLKEEKRFRLGLKDIARYEEHGWKDVAKERGVGVVCLGAIALTLLGEKRGFAAQIVGPTTPSALLPEKAPLLVAP